MRAAKPLLLLLRLLAGVEVVLGIGFWTGHWFGLRPLHMALGVLFVVAVWSLAGLALAARRTIGLAVFAIVWGVILAGFGASQQGLLAGDLHWIVRVAHLAMVLAAMPIAERLGRLPG
jgi:hypothetical protein